MCSYHKVKFEFPKWGDSGIEGEIQGMPAYSFIPMKIACEKIVTQLSKVATATSPKVAAGGD